MAKILIMKVFKVIAKGITYGTYASIDQARKLRNLLKGKGATDLVISITEEDIDPYKE